MNISPLTIYLWQLSDSVITAAGTLCIPATVIIIIGLVMWVINAAAEAERLVEVNGNNPSMRDKKEHAVCKSLHHIGRRLTLFGTILLPCCIAVYVFVPRSNTIAMMVVIPEIAQSKVIQEDLPDLYNTAIEALKSSLKK